MIKLKAREIKLGMRGIEVAGKIVSVEDRREVQTRFGPAFVATAILEDDTGSVRINLWRGQIDQAKAGDSVIVTNAFAKEFGSRIELNIGQDGAIKASPKT